MKSPLQTKSYRFALDIIHLSRKLNVQKEFVLSRQILRSGTAIGASIREAKFAQSSKDFISKLSIALKEANETDCWIDLPHDAECIDGHGHRKLAADCHELISMLVSSVKTMKARL